MIAIELLLLQIGSQIILAGGIFLLAFSGLEWTRDYAERYVHTFFHIGVKMLFIYILVGIGAGLTKNWAQILDNIPNRADHFNMILRLSWPPLFFIYFVKNYRIKQRFILQEDCR